MIHLACYRFSGGQLTGFTALFGVGPIGVVMTEPAIQTRELRKNYGDVQALDGLDLTVDRGEFFSTAVSWTVLLGRLPVDEVALDVVGTLVDDRNPRVAEHTGDTVLQ